MTINQDSILLRLRQWLMRKTSDGSTRQMAQMPLVISSDIGNVRAENQDRVAVLRAQVTPSRSFLVAVLCDGMGGMEDGAGCASLSVAAFLSSCIRNRNLDAMSRIKVAVDYANEAVNNEYNQKGGATLSAFLIDNNGGFVAVNVGDSRIYCISENKLSQLSDDDTLAAQINQSEVPSHMRNELLQFIGMGDDLDPHFISIPDLNSVSTLLMTSDGLHYMNKDTMEAVIRYADEPNAKARRLVKLAKWCGGKDNVSLVVVENPISILDIEGDQPFPSGTVEICDAYGDVQLIGAEKTSSIPVENQITESSKKKSSDAKLEKDPVFASLEKDDEKANKKPKNKKRPRVRGKKAKATNEKAEHKPQIKIDFE